MTWDWRQPKRLRGGGDPAATWILLVLLLATLGAVTWVELDGPAALCRWLGWLKPA